MKSAHLAEKITGAKFGEPPTSLVMNYRGSPKVFQTYSLSESEAFTMLRNTAMQQGRKIGAIADAVVQSARSKEKGLK